jgi:transcription elongation factor Elf1
MTILDQAHIGFPCPECPSTIRPSMPQLVSGAPIYCSGCGLKLQVDLRASAASLKELEAFNKQQEKAQALRKQATRFDKPNR